MVGLRDGTDNEEKYLNRISHIPNTAKSPVPRHLNSCCNSTKEDMPETRLKTKSVKDSQPEVRSITRLKIAKT
jgi:hypothetical protein